MSAYDSVQLLEKAISNALLVISLSDSMHYYNPELYNSLKNKLAKIDKEINSFLSKNS